MKYSNSDARIDAAIGLEAGEWLLRLEDPEPDGEPEFPDLDSRDQAFYQWLGKSPDHLRIFLETLEVHRRMSLIDADHVIQVESLLERRFADVIPLPQTMRQKARARAARGKSDDASMPTRRLLFGATAAVLVCAIAGGIHWWTQAADRVSTALGEQRTAKLADGSFIYLNTDTQVKIDFSDRARSVRLLHGEALFVVERDSSRPFIVTAGDTTVRAIGTQFNVRKREQGADVAVVEGTVQVTTKEAPEKLVAGEQATIVNGHMAPPTHRVAVEDTIAWRQRRLVFHDARLADVAAEFNRYNRTKIRVEGEAARNIQLSGIFDADRPQALLLYAAKNAEFTLQPEGDNWLIRGR